MDLTLPITTGGLAVIISGFLAKKAFGYCAGLVAQFKAHIIEDDKRAADTILAHTELKGDIALIHQKVDNLGDKLSERTERIDNMDKKLDTIILRLPNK